MAKQPPGVLHANPFPSQAQTLFLEHPGTAGILVTRSGRRSKAEPRRFSGGAAALEWCQANRVAMVYWFAPGN
jgi:hypothetical protein